MANEIKLKDFVTSKHFATIQKGFARHFQLGLETTGIDGSEIRGMCTDDCHPEFCKIVRSSPNGARRCRQNRLRSLNISIESGQPYTSLCHAGIVLICVPVMDHQTPLGGLFFGKCLWEQFNETIEADILKRLRGLRMNKDRLIKAARKLPVVSGRRIHDAAEFLFILFYETTGLDPCVIHWRRQRTKQQSEISEVIQQSKKLGIEMQYPYQTERELIGKVKIGDRIGANEILNSLLGTIMFQNPGDLNILKARLVELLSVLSRAAVEGGVDINLLLEKNLYYIGKVMNLNSQEDICAWLNNALNDFIESVQSSLDFRKISRIKPAVDFIEANFDQSLSLDDIAAATFLSVSRLAHLFKEEMGITLIDYLTNVRIRHAKQMLLATDKNCTEVCFSVGYNNQSYFTRTFKSIVGMTPRQFRENNLNG